MSGKHTPGEWSVRFLPGAMTTFACIEADSPDNPEDVVRLATLPGEGVYAEVEGPANARLMAKAPEMLALLKATVERWDDLHEGEYDDTNESVRALLAELKEAE